MQIVTALHTLTGRLARALALAGLAGLLVLSITVVADIVLRATLDHPLQGVNDLYAVLMAVVIAACMPNALLTRQNIAIEILGEALDKVWGGRLRAALDCFASAATLAFFGMLVWQFIPYAASVSASGQKTWVLKWPVGPWWWAATALFAVAVLAQVMVFLADLSRLLWPHRAPPGAAATDAPGVPDADGGL
jgi:TRAP-type C4-dicarboxylate transport system permease small subunit